MITTIAFYSALIFVGAIVIKTIKEEIIDDKKTRNSTGDNKNKKISDAQFIVGMAEDEERREQQHE